MKSVCMFLAPRLAHGTQSGVRLCLGSPSAPEKTREIYNKHALSRTLVDKCKYYSKMRMFPTLNWFIMMVLIALSCNTFGCGGLTTEVVCSQGVHPLLWNG